MICPPGELWARTGKRLHGSLLSWLEARLHHLVLAQLRASTFDAESLAVRLDSLDEGIEDLFKRVERLESGLACPPFSPNMTVVRALAAHPGVLRLFKKRQLPSCQICPVAFDETLEEVAKAHGFSLREFMHELNNLDNIPI